MQFDTADVTGLQSSGLLDDVILHELAHVFGFGVLWYGDLVGAGTPDPRYVGLVARGAWDAVPGGSGASVPVQSGDPGTGDAHWRESVLGNELMTGFIDAGANPLSAVTVGALADLGYGVDLAAADPFGGAAFRAAPGAGLHVETELIRPRELEG